MNAYEVLREAVARALLRDSATHPIVRNDEEHFDSWMFDIRSVILEPEVLNAYANIFWERFAHAHPFQVAGMETAAIPLVTAIIMKGVERGTPVHGFYIRKSRKRTGRLRVLEGSVGTTPVILVDDIANSGGSLDTQIKMLHDAKLRVSDAFVLLAFRTHDTYAPVLGGTKFTSVFSLPEFGLQHVAPAPVRKSSLTIQWRYQSPNPSLHLVRQKSAPALDTERVYVGCDDGAMRAINIKDGSLAWQFYIEKFPRGKAILSSPALHNETLFFGAYDGVVYALDARTGSLRWRYDDADWVGSSPCIAAPHHTVYIGLEYGLFKRRGGIAALSLETGALLWQQHMPELTHATPLWIPQHALVVIGNNDGVFRGYDSRSGDVRFAYTTAGRIQSAPVYDPARDLILFGSMDSHCYAIHSDGTPAFALQTGAGIYSTPVIERNHAYVASLDKSVYAINLDTGRETARFDTNGRIFSSPLITENSLWIGNNGGVLYRLSLESLSLMDSMRFSERIVNKVAYDTHTRRLFVPTVANEVYCIALQT